MTAVDRFPGPELTVQDLRDVVVAVKADDRDRVAESAINDRLGPWAATLGLDIRLPYRPTMVYRTGFRWAARWDFAGGSLEIWVGYNTNKRKEHEPFADVKITMAHAPAGWASQVRWYEVILTDYTPRNKG